MTYKLFCGDVMPGCTARFESPDRTDLLQQVGHHAAADHQIHHLTPDTLRSVESRISLSA